MRLVAALGIALVPWAGGCTDGVACTEIGCASAVIVELGPDVDAAALDDVTACIDGDCSAAAVQSVRVDTEDGRIDVALTGSDWGGQHTIQLRAAADGETVLEVDAPVEMQPEYANGEDCGVTCHVGVLEP